MAFGTAPGQAVKDDWDEVEEGSPVFYAANTHDLMKYFFYHPKVKFGRPKPSARESGALAKSLKKLRMVYTDDAIRRAIDKFYLTRTAKNHANPAFAFCNKEFQDKLFEGAEQVEIQDDVLTFIANGFQREDGIDLPWDEEYDSNLRVTFIIDQDYNVLARTFPEVVAEILYRWGNDVDGSGSLIMQQALLQMHYLSGASDKPADLSDLHANFDVPIDFTKRVNRPRKTKDTITEAVRSARGR